MIPVRFNSAKAIYRATVALDARVVRVHEVKLRRINDVRCRRLTDVFDPRSMTTFTANIPFGHRLRLNVVVHRMEPSHSGSVGRACCQAVKRHPPVGIRLDRVGSPNPVRDVPLGQTTLLEELLHYQQIRPLLHREVA